MSIKSNGLLLLPPPPPPPPLPVNLVENKISPSILLIIVILAVIFFVSGLLHLLLRYLLRPTTTLRDPENVVADTNATALQGQLQQLFHLHDAGVDQTFIDALPVFLYKAIVGAIKDPFDCAVCLCEFEPDHKLRLLPKCSHAFHVDCIDTWLLTHSTCPLCRSTLLPTDFSPSRCCSPILLLLESASESSREIGRPDLIGPPPPPPPPPPPYEGVDELGAKEKDQETQSSCSSGEDEMDQVSEAKVVQVKLGKFRSVVVDVRVDAEEEGSSSSNANLDQLRCFSMGTYEYVMNDNNLLQVAIKPPKKKKLAAAGSSSSGGRQYAMSECDGHSRREGFKLGFSEEYCAGVVSSTTARITTSSKRESFSISKIWLRSKKEKPAAAASDGSCSRRAFSFRLPALMHHESKARSEVSPWTASESDSEFQAPESEKNGDLDMEVGSCNNSVVSMGSQIEAVPSFARRTVHWIVGRQNRVGSMS